MDLAALLYPDTHTTYGAQLTGDTSEGSAVFNSAQKYNLFYWWLDQGVQYIH